MKNSKFNAAKKLSMIAAAGTLAVGTASATDVDIFEYNSLGSGNEVRTELMNDNSELAEFMTIETTFEGKCGEGKCGEGKCGEGKCGEGEEEEEESEEESEEEGEEGKEGEGKCGEGKCGEGSCGQA